MTDEGALSSLPVPAADAAASPYARWGRRAIAFVVDASLVGLAAGLLAAATGHHQPLNTFHTHVVNGRTQLVPVGSTLDFFSAVEVLLAFAMAVGCFATRWRATPGMRLLGIYLALEDDDGRVGLGRSVRRAAIFAGATLVAGHVPLGAAVLGVLLLWPLWDPRRQALHDKLVGTVVLHGAVPG